jgi:hypothetical protein
LLTGGVSSPPPPPFPHPPRAGAHWQGWPEIRADLRSSAWLAIALALAGLPTGVLWWLLAPRADYRITADGPVVLGQPSEELLVADDAVFVLILVGVGLVCGAAAWWLRRRRGVATMLALAVGGTLTAVVAWQLGELLGAGPTEAELTEVGNVVTTSLTLGSLPGLAIAPFAAVLAYVVGVLYVAEDNLNRAGDPAPPAWVGEPPLEDDRTLAEVPPPGRPSPY